jgi:hypothetical protein
VFWCVDLTRIIVGSTRTWYGTTQRADSSLFLFTRTRVESTSVWFNENKNNNEKKNKESISAYLIFFLRFVESPEALKIENSHMKVKNWSWPISIWYYFCMQIVADSKNVKILLFGGRKRLKLNKIWRNFENIIYFDLIWPPVVEIDLQTTKFYIFGISEQFAIRKNTILIYRATSIFDLHMRIFNLQGLGAPDKQKKN